ncbi:MAG: hypothetical protein RIT32_769 [Actinomycetota bacterium]|jgi:DNA polymerase-3 subunit epsilon
MHEQIAFEDLGQPLHEVTFAVLDIETTGGSAETDSITEIGIVKVKGGEVIGEFQTLVNPGTAIPIQIQVLTGITTSMVIAAPKISEVLPHFFEFVAGAIPVAHNARFDIGFLKSAALRHGYNWNLPKALDTVQLAKLALGRDEVRNRKLATLAERFGTKIQPNHRALADAQATVEVFHALLERLGRMGIYELADLQQLTPKMPEQIRAKAKLAESVPNQPGCYLFKDAQSNVLYVGVSQDLKKRVRSYFTRGENRKHVRDAIAITHSVSTVVCSTALEARVRELRLIAQHRPPANRVARNPEKIWWLYFNNESVPRLISSKTPPGLEQPAIGPFNKKIVADELGDFLNDQFKLRDCVDKLATRPNHPGCIRGEINHCSMPCQQDPIDDYLATVDVVKSIMLGDKELLVDALMSRIRQLATAERFEEAQRLKDLLDYAIRGINRIAKLREISRIAEFVSVTQSSTQIEVHVIRHGRLVAAGAAADLAQAETLSKALRQSAEQVEPRGLIPAKALAGYDDAPAAIGEAELLLNLADFAALFDRSAELLPLS